MTTCINSEVDWLKEHAEKGADGVWRCKKTKAEIGKVIVGRSIWIKPFMGGYGEVRQVTHIACPSCTPNKDVPPYGKPIYEDELVEF